MPTEQLDYRGGLVLQMPLHMLNCSFKVAYISLMFGWFSLAVSVGLGGGTDVCAGVYSSVGKTVVYREKC